MKITISNELKVICPPISLGILHYYADVTKSSEQIINYLNTTINNLTEKYSMETIIQNEHIASTRRAYKALGKSPAEYRNAAEAMLRRIVKESGLYHINNIVEVNNIVSILSGYSIGSYDVSKIQGSLELRHAEDGTSELDSWMKKFAELLENFCNVRGIEMWSL